MLAEAKASFIHWVARSVLEKASPSVRLYKVDGAGIETAKDWEGRHDFHQAAIHCFSTYQNPVLDAETRGEAFFEFIQQLINLGAFRQARETLNTEFGQLTKLELLPQERVLLMARREEKLGWLADYELGYFESISHFQDAERELSSFPQRDWTIKIKELNSTTKHFIGRAEYGLAVMGVRQERNLSRAIRHFQEALGMDEGIDDPNRNGKLALGHAWVARCFMRQGDIGGADKHIQEAGEFSSKQLEANPANLGPLAHQHLLLGERRLRGGSLDEALDRFREAARIRRESAPYPKGLADAYYGLFLGHLRSGHLVAPVYLWRAFKTHPYTALRGIIGG